MTEKPLYQDEKLRIGFHPDSRLNTYLLIGEGVGNEYVITSGELGALAQTPRGGIEERIARLNRPLLDNLKDEGIGIDWLHVALCQAYMKAERRIEAVIRGG